MNTFAEVAPLRTVAPRAADGAALKAIAALRPEDGEEPSPRVARLPRKQRLFAAAAIPKPTQCQRDDISTAAI